VRETERTRLLGNAVRLPRLAAALGLTLCVALGTAGQGARAESLDDAVERLFGFDGNGDACGALIAGSTLPLNQLFSGGMLRVCGRGNNVGASTSTGGGAGAAAARPEAVRKRIDAEDDALGGNAPVRGFFGSVGTGVSDRAITQFQDGFQGDVTTFSAGLDSEFGEWVAGFSVNYEKADGDFANGGDFETDSLGPTFFASRPLNDNAQFDVYFGLDSIGNERRRRATFESPSLGPPATGTPAADFDADKTLAGGQFTYLISKGNVTITPRVALDWEQTDFDGYRETDVADSGLALVVADDKRTSFIATFGIEASAALSTKFGVVVVGEHLDYKHELDDDQRNITASFANDIRAQPVLFQFQTDPPDSGWLEFGVDAIFVFQSGLQVFAAYNQMSSHAYLDTSMLSAGIRKEF
jgi:outer membrane autotransporter protein